MTTRHRLKLLEPQLSIVSALLVLGAGFFITGQAQIVVTIGQNFTASTLNIDSSAMPPDPNGAVGQLHFVEFINGRVSIFNKANGSKVASSTDISFWNQAGITLPSGWDVTDPRIIYDPVSQRWFASQVDFDATGTINTNHFLLAVSSTSDPTGSWKGLAIDSDPGGNYFADFPTLGLDSQGIYLSGDMLDTNANPIGPSLISIPKSGLLAAPPIASGRTSFGLMNYSVRGRGLQPAICFDGSGQGTVLATAGVGLDTNGNLVTNQSLVTFQVQNASSSGAATLSSSSFLSVPPYTAPPNPTQPDTSSNLDDRDARFSANVYEVGGVLFAVHNVEVNNLAALRWYRIEGSTQSVLESGTITDPVMDLFFPSIAANSAGTIVIAFNGSSTNTFVSSFAVVGNTANGVTTFSSPVLLKAGSASYQNPDLSGLSRWGDYSTTCVDPADHNRFWTIQQFPAGTNVWSTQVTELITGSPNLSFAVSGNNLILSWSATTFNLETTSSLGNPNWIRVTQNLSTNNGVVSTQVTMDGGKEFFRLHSQ